MKAVKWLLAMVAVLVGLVGVPLIFLAGPSPFDPDRGVGSIVRAVINDTQIFEEAVLSVFIGVGWVLWAYLVVSAVIELVQSVQGKVRSVAGFDLGRSLVGPLVSALIWSSAATSVAVSVAGAGGTSVLFAQAAQAGPGDGAGTADSGRQSSTFSDGPIVKIDDESLMIEGRLVRPHLVAKDQATMWGLAERHLGDPFRWVEIAELNGGESIDSTATDPDQIGPGTIVLMPGDATGLRVPPSRDLDVLLQPFEATEPSPSESSLPPEGSGAGALGSDGVVESQVVEVSPGDNLWSITSDALADRLGRTPTDEEVAAAWAETVAANRGLIRSGDPDLIFPTEEVQVMVPAPASAAHDDLDRPDEPLDGLNEVTDSSITDLVGASLDRSAAAKATPDGVESEFIDKQTLRSVALEGQGPADGDGPDPGPPSVGDDRAAVEASIHPAAESVTQAPSEAPGGPASAESAAPASEFEAGQEPKDESGDGEELGDGDGLGSGQAPETGDGLGRGDGPGDGNGSGDGPGVIPLVGIGSFGMACLAGGIVGSIRRRRDRQRRQRRPFTLVEPPSSKAAAFEAVLAHAAAQVVDSELGAGWRAIPTAAIEQLEAFGPTEFHLESSGVLRAVPLDPGPDPSVGPGPDTSSGPALGPDHGPEPDAEPSVVELDESGVAAGTDDPKQTLVPISATSLIVGTAPDTGDAVFLDLVSAGQVSLRGERSAIYRFAHSAVVDLALSDRADALSVVAVGIATGLADLERVTVVESFAGAAALIKGSGVAADTPLVIVSGQGPLRSTPEIAELVEAGAAIVAPGLEADIAIELVGDRARICPDGTTVDVTALTGEQYEAVCELVDTTSTSGLSVVDPAEVLDRLDVVDPQLCPVEAGPVEVRVLGPVEVQGASSFSSVRALGVVAYLAFNRNGADADQIKSWVWPAFEPPTDKAFANVMSRARSGLGVDSAGDPRLSRAGSDRTYRLLPEVTTDFERFCGLQRLADESEEAHAELELLRQAVNLIRGVPFTGGAPSAFAWVDDCVRAHVEYTVDEAVHRCADLALELGDFDTARWALRKGFDLVPGCEQCFRRRFQVAAADQNRDELRRAMHDLERSASLDLGEPEGMDVISPDLLVLYRELDRSLSQPSSPQRHLDPAPGSGNGHSNGQSNGRPADRERELVDPSAPDDDEIVVWLNDSARSTSPSAEPQR